MQVKLFLKLTLKKEQTLRKSKNKQTKKEK